MSTSNNNCSRGGNTMNAPNYRLVDGVSDVYAPSPANGDIIRWATTNRRWESGVGFGGYFKAGTITTTATCNAWVVPSVATTLIWAQAGPMVTLYIPTLSYITQSLGPSSDIIHIPAIPNYLWPVQASLTNGRGINIGVTVGVDTTVTISTVGVIEIFKGNFDPTNFNHLDGTISGSYATFVTYKINFVATGGGTPIPPTPPPALAFTGLTDSQAVYVNPNSLLRVKPAANGVSEMNLQATLPAANQFTLTSGTSALAVTNSCTINQDLSTTGTPQFSTLHITGKATFDGLIDPPTGLQLATRTTNPGDSKTIWTDGTIVYFGAIAMGANNTWWCSVDKTIQANMRATATVTLTGSGGVGELAAAVSGAVDGDVIAIQSSLGYSPIVIPHNRRFCIRVDPGYGAYLTGANCLTFAIGARDVTIIGLGWDTCTTTDANALGSAVCMLQSALINRIIFTQCNFRTCAGSAVMLSYHQTIGADTYNTANVYPGEFSNNIAFVDCSFSKATTDATEGGAMVLRGFEGPMVQRCTSNCQGIGGRGFVFQNCKLAWCESNYTTGGAGTGNGEGIKLDRLGSPTYYNSGYFLYNTSKANVQGIDLDDFDSVVAIGNRCFQNTGEGLCLCGVDNGIVVSNTCWENNDGIALEVGVTSFKLYNNNSFLNTTNNYRLDMGGSPNDSNLSSVPSSIVGADSIPFVDSTSTLASKNVSTSINEILNNTVVITKSSTGMTDTDRTNTALAINTGASPTFTITPTGTRSYYIAGKKFSFSSPLSCAITNVQGMHYFTFDGTGAVVEYLTQTQAMFARTALVAMCYWQYNVTPASAYELFLGDERHEFMPWQSHWLEHNTTGCAYISGGALDGFTIGNGSLDSHAQFGCSAGGVIRDEDIDHTLTSKAAASGWYVYARSGPTDWAMTYNSAFPVIVYSGGSGISYNSFSSPNWGYSAVTDNRYTLCHIFQTNSYYSNRYLIAVMGQAEYNSLNAARNGANVELSSLVLSGLPTLEWVPLGTVIYQSNSGYANNAKARVVLTDTSANYVDWRQKKINATSSPTSHHNLADLTAFDDHTQYVQTSTLAPVDGNIAKWDGVTGRLLKDGGISEEHGTFDATFLGPWAPTTYTITCLYSRVGKSVTLKILQLAPALSTGASIAQAAAATIPASVRPSDTVVGSINVADGGYTILGSLHIYASGAIDIAKNNGNFSSGVNVGWNSAGISYPIS